jgi:hypothetical protein
MAMDPVGSKLRDQAVMSSPTRCQRIGFGDGNDAVSRAVDTHLHDPQVRGVKPQRQPPGPTGGGGEGQEHGCHLAGQGSVGGLRRSGVVGEDVAEIDGVSVADDGDICAAILATDDDSGSAAVGGARTAGGGKADNGCACTPRSAAEGWWLDRTCDRSPG